MEREQQSEQIAPALQHPESVARTSSAEYLLHVFLLMTTHTTAKTVLMPFAIDITTAICSTLNHTASRNLGVGIVVLEELYTALLRYQS